MMIQKYCNFITEATELMTSQSFYNANGDVLSVQINGDDGEYQIEGRLDSEFEWAPMAGVNLSTMSLKTGALTSAGIYEFDIIGTREIRARVVSTQGTVSIKGQIISSGEG